MRMLLSAIGILLLVGCSTTYQETGFTGGYSTTQLAENVFQVKFAGNAYTGEERAADFAMLRSAEIALEHGFNFFAIVDAAQYEQLSTYTAPAQTQTTYTGNTMGTVTSYGNRATYNGTTMGTANTTVTGGQTFVYHKPRASNTIFCFKEKPEGFAFDANFVRASIRGKYKLDAQSAPTGR